MKIRVVWKKSLDDHDAMEKRRYGNNAQSEDSVQAERGDEQQSKFIFKDTIEKAIVFSPAISEVSTKEGINIFPAERGGRR
jgi:hypothetical protein